MNPRTMIIGVVTAIGAFLFLNSVYTVKQIHQVLVLQFGEPVRVVTKPGLHFKIPFIQNLVVYDNRLLDLDPPVINVLLTDKKRINIDAYARYRITDPLEFFKRVRTETALRDRLGKTIGGALRRVIATTSLTELLSSKRMDVTQQIQHEILDQAKSLGVEIVDVRIGRTELPGETSAAVFQRMRTERAREARELRAEGEEIANATRAKADKEKTLIMANAERDGNRLRGEGEALRNKRLAEAFGQDPDFFRFYKTLEQYQKLSTSDNTVLVVSPDNQFLNYLDNAKGESVKGK